MSVIAVTVRPVLLSIGVKSPFHSLTLGQPILNECKRLVSTVNNPVRYLRDMYVH